MKKYLSVNCGGNVQKDAHRIVAEQAFGKPLPKRAIVHHIDYDGRNNKKSNLVICPTQKYHLLLHSRTDALLATGNAEWRKCNLCQKWDAPENLAFYERPKYLRTHHKECNRLYQRFQRARRKLECD